jgi:hypothetical protein
VKKMLRSEERRLRRNLRFMADIHLPWCERTGRDPDPRIVSLIEGWQEELAAAGKYPEGMTPSMDESEAWAYFIPDRYLL